MLPDSKRSAVFIAIGMTIAIVTVQAAVTNAGGAALLDANCLLQASLQHPWVPLPEMQQPHTSRPWMKINQLEPENSPRDFDHPNLGLTTELHNDINYYNRTEWDLDTPETQGWITGVVSNPNGSKQTQNLCAYGHLIPEFILIGVVKGATTSFATDMRRSPDIFFPSNCNNGDYGDGFCANNTAKEGHFFDYAKSYGLMYVAQLYPKCQSNVRMVAADMSPRYMIDHTVPKTIQHWYLDMARRIKFIVILREPIARFHSDFYHAQAVQWCDIYGSRTFAEIVKLILEENTWRLLIGGNFNCTDRLEGSLYPDALGRWYDVFEPRQFIIAPYKYVTQPEERGGKSVADTVWNILGVRPGIVRHDSHFNDRQHPALSQDIGKKMLQRFKSWIYSINGPLQVASVLASRPGAKLFGYTGEVANRTTIRQWLEDNW